MGDTTDVSAGRLLDGKVWAQFPDEELATAA
jgi:hypothetical protein